MRVVLAHNEKYIGQGLVLSVIKLLAIYFVTRTISTLKKKTIKN